MIKNNIIKTYAAYNVNTMVRLESSSGGIFSELAENILQKSGVVYGVALSENCRYARFMRIDTLEELCKIRGSKYIPVKMGNTFYKVKKDLDSGRNVLFSGTGCQIKGLIGYLEGNTENLLCVEIICHGFPSITLWHKYLDYIENRFGGSVTNVNFRYKGNRFNRTIEKKANNTILYYSSLSQDPYMRLYLKDYCLRPSCYNCCAKQERRSDITIGDFWGVEELFPEMSNKKGISLVMIRTENGMKAWDNISNFVTSREVKYEDSIRKNPAEYSSASLPKEYEEFLSDLMKLRFDELGKKYDSPRKRNVKSLIKILLSQLLNVSYGDDYGILFEIKRK